MKVLNRPMFRYGGPIKEGVMSGIREPKKNGGLSKQFNTGLVGDERYPKTDGREHHFAFLAPAAMAAARFLPAAYRGFKAARAYAPLSQNLGVAGRLKNIFMPKGGISAPMAPTGAGAGFRTGSFLRQNPLTALPLAGLAIEGGGRAAAGLAKMSPSLLKQYANTVIPFADPFTIDKEKVNIDINQDPNLGKTTKELAEGKTGTGTGTEKGAGSGAELSAKEKRAKKIQEYRDIMDIKGMNKQAAYDSLIAASQAVNQAGGDLKGAIKDGSLINQIIQSTSKAFDKPAKTKEGIDTLILKGEIEKDIKASDPSNQILNELRVGQLKKINKELEGSNFAENKAVIKKAGGTGQSGINDAAALNNEDYRGNLVVKTDLDKVIKGQKEKGILDDKEIVVSYTNTLIEGKDLANGDYTVGDYLITIKDNKVYDIAR
jgi:hypothetical protein